MNRTYLFLFFLLICYQTLAQQITFKVIPLGVKGGGDESNLSSYMVAPVNSDEYVCLDAGTLRSGIQTAIAKGSFSKSIDRVLKENIKGYLISHGHLDHVAGMIINSPDDTTKNIYALPSVLEVLRNSYFTWKSWANFTDEGDKPALNKYHYVPLDSGKEVPLTNTSLSVTPFVLSHVKPYQSTAFLVRHQDVYLLYLGDTGADAVEHSDKLKQLWQSVSPLIRSKKLKAIFMEVSFPNHQPDKQLFGHLTPQWLMQEMNTLSSLTGKDALINFPVVITHIKPPVAKEHLIQKQLLTSNDLHLHIIFPEQGRMLKF
ncbi:MAG: 3',5'-cyclic-nucleotide phosphodiesterase [Bacteroidetes bacterium]|nr:3',5'-cyclic-nucleotide phosphodiesterase [Bacteroidota bacterium]MBS1541989.1 3',5'-cyclic-nucleotide phosphodiesterase [Bacteroidota bacterium]